MKNRWRKKLGVAIGSLLAFILWTVAVRSIDVQAIGPNESIVGFAALNGFVHNLMGVHWALYVLTDWLGLVPVCFMVGFAILGLTQWIRRKRLLSVDHSVLVLGAFYLVVTATYLFFEQYVINYRPVLVNGFLEASYPSSTTLLVLTVMPTAAMQLKERIKQTVIKRSITAAINGFVLFMVAGRLISGVHWITDIIGGALLSVGLVAMYGFACDKGQGDFP